jgi:hypothetical protein
MLATLVALIDARQAAHANDPPKQQTNDLTQPAMSH